MPLSPAGWIIVIVSFQRRVLDRRSSSKTLILTRTRTSDHITPVLRSLHSLTVTCKVLSLVYNGLGPKYMQVFSLNINLTEHSDQYDRGKYQAFTQNKGVHFVFIIIYNVYFTS